MDRRKRILAEAPCKLNLHLRAGRRRKDGYHEIESVFQLISVYDSLSVNGYMTSYLCSSQKVESGESAILDIELMDDSLEENKIASPSDVQEIEVGFEIKEGSTTMDEPTITLPFGE